MEASATDFLKFSTMVFVDQKSHHRNPTFKILDPPLHPSRKYALRKYATIQPGFMSNLYLFVWGRLWVPDSTPLRGGGALESAVQVVSQQ